MGMVPSHHTISFFRENFTRLHFGSGVHLTLQVGVDSHMKVSYCLFCSGCHVTWIPVLVLRHGNTLSTLRVLAPSESTKLPPNKPIISVCARCEWKSMISWHKQCEFIVSIHTVIQIKLNLPEHRSWCQLWTALDGHHHNIPAGPAEKDRSHRNVGVVWWFASTGQV